MSPKHHAPWRIIRKIGTGAQGDASLVEHRETGSLAVRKTMSNYLVFGKHKTPLEATILQQILPPSSRIVHLITSFEQPDKKLGGMELVEFFEYCRGGDLQHAVQGALGHLPEDFIWHCFIQIAEALDIVHNGGTQRVVHADIKPDNIFLTAKYLDRAPWPNLKLGDFGCAKLNERENEVHVPSWQGPEIPLLSRAGDIWGLGAIVHWMAHGRTPMRPRPPGFPGSERDWGKLPEARRVKALPREYSRRLNEHMLDCLEWNPKDRVSSRVLAERLKKDRRRVRV